MKSNTFDRFIFVSSSMMSVSLLVSIMLLVQCIGGTVEKFKTAGENSCFLNAIDEFTCIGYNYYGQLGLPGRDTGFDGTIGDDDDETGDNLPVIDLGGDLTVVDFDVGLYSVCAIRSDNKVVCWGALFKGENGMLSISSDDDPANATISDTGSIIPVSIQDGGSSVFILDADGNAYGWGDNDHGKLGYGSTTTRVGAEYMGDNLEKIDLGAGRTVVKIEPSFTFTCALLDDSTVKCFGENGDSGYLGQNSTMDYGDEPDTMGDNLPAIDFGDGFIPKDIGVMSDAACALSTLGEIKCWGSSSTGQLGLESGSIEKASPAGPVNIGTGRTAIQMETGRTHICVLRDDGSVVCWGQNTDFNLGTGTDMDVGNKVGDMGDNLVPIDYGDTDVVSDIVCGFFITCLMFEDKRAKCYGRNDFGALGYGDIKYSGAKENASTVDYMMFRSVPDVDPPTECSIVISTEGDSSLTWDLTDSEGDEEIAAGAFGGDSVTLTASTSEEYLLFLSSPTTPSGSITVTIDGEPTTYQLDSSMSTDSEIAEITCAGITAATTDGSVQASMSLNVLLLSSVLLII